MAVAALPHVGCSALGQIGEFSFVVLGLGVAAGAVTRGQFSATLAAAAITIAASAVGARLFPGARSAPQVAEVGEFGVPEHGIIVDVEFGVEGHDPAIL